MMPSSCNCKNIIKISSSVTGLFVCKRRFGRLFPFKHQDRRKHTGSHSPNLAVCLQPRSLEAPRRDSRSDNISLLSSTCTLPRSTSPTSLYFTLLQSTLLYSALRLLYFALICSAFDYSTLFCSVSCTTAITLLSCVGL